MATQLAWTSRVQVFKVPTPAMPAKNKTTKEDGAQGGDGLEGGDGEGVAPFIPGLLGLGACAAGLEPLGPRLRGADIRVAAKRRREKEEGSRCATVVWKARPSAREY